ncbi:hypothetical protein K461DRAFT_46877 [Myriangium duriaei CBS 260.36]|uniref:Xylanolytic transcriptional activator regulatory domain-containing protein n=1 Tax=Myriangium duriaei CBS 260.36 TaxID=1168546 RepID=A0A9P4MD34_9PEZI|nr:hypothetical protein K461DRAFT_46877 [Myriangium duriaei CBS 260.36]
MQYTGEAHGTIAAVVNLVRGFSSHSSHYVVPQSTRKRQGPEELRYLEAMGVFSVPSQETCDALIQAYFVYVHPLLPILDASELLVQYESAGYRGINLLLLWSMFVNAAGFLDQDTLERAGYKSHRAFKETAYDRAKLLYDTAWNENQTTLLQAVLLMSHHHADEQDRFEAWHWTGVAISLCQAAGLHRLPANAPEGRGPWNESRHRLLRRICWSCFCRDKWIALFRGRPARMRLEDCKLGRPVPEDVMHDLQRLPPSLKVTHLPLDPGKVGHAWCKSVEIGVLLGRVLDLSISSETSNTQSICDVMEADLIKCDWPLEDNNSGMNDFERLCTSQSRLLFHSTCVAFWRIRALPSSTSTTVIAESSQTHIVEKARTAASKFNIVLEEVVNRDLFKYLMPPTVGALIPPMHFHLFDCLATKASVRVLGSHRLQLCMQVLSELKTIYWAASFTLKLFECAREKLARRSGTSRSGRGSNIHEPLQSDDPSIITSSLSNGHQDLLDPQFLLADYNFEGFFSPTTMYHDSMFLYSMPNGGGIGLDDQIF